MSTDRPSHTPLPSSNTASMGSFSDGFSDGFAGDFTSTSSDQSSGFTSSSTPASTPRLFALIANAGSGLRAQTRHLPKQYHRLCGSPVVIHTLRAFAQLPLIERCFVVISPGDVYWAEHAATFLDGLRAIKTGLRPQALPCGGATRQASVQAGLNALQTLGVTDDDWVLVHDAARCLVTPADIQRLIDACWGQVGGGLLATPVTDTLHVEDNACVSQALPRQPMWQAQTPQMFRMSDLQLAFSLPSPPNGWTDEASALLATGLAPQLVPSHSPNFKLTYPQDLEWAELILRHRSGMDPASGQASSSTTSAAFSSAGASSTSSSPSSRGASSQSGPAYRLGEGWDTHALVPNRPLILGGVHIPYHLGLSGHSDADALLHAITDALLGACGLGDIGTWFPDKDPRFKDADSWHLLQEAAYKARSMGLEPLNVDATVIAQAPQLGPYKAAMVQRISQALQIPAAQVNVKAKTAEKLGPVGEGKSVEARAVVLVQRH
jgi:2-C-methyl-D-erythritol 4-phosphate cytidylyltransferase/2-C-methyl-D-erythritol 2,4-cyclodiphosphate synthase